jgi:hypothetical protein
MASSSFQNDNNVLTSSVEKLETDPTPPAGRDSTSLVATSQMTMLKMVWMVVESLGTK